ncbi:MAG: hypothetical protein FD180_2384 [Planctomycetota bacterium]|nr:MAG: hypothetical protein FD180_2384 [Planctomycetota bacterium]
MDRTGRDILLKRLGDAMSAISEDCYCAGWLQGTEYMVPELCRRALSADCSMFWGHGKITVEQAKELTMLAEQLRSWADTDEESIGYNPFQPFPIPPEFLAAIDREQTIGQGGG